MKEKLRTSVRALLGVGDDESLQDFVAQRGGSLRRHGTQALRKLEQVLQGLGIAPPPRRDDGAGSIAEDGSSEIVPQPERNKFDLGQGIDRTPPREHIPWGYGQDRVTAMAVDPERLYVYWEVTDEAIARARAGLGPGGADSWLNLRVYDVTGRIFDGTNAHGYFDHRVERHDRQWFFAIDKPGSSAIVELGLKSREGYFVRIARSGRVDFPRTTPAPARAVEWMTVRTLSEDAAPSWQTPPPAQDARPLAATHATPCDDASRVVQSADIEPTTETTERWTSVEDLPVELREVLGGATTREATSWEWAEALPSELHEVASNGAWTGEVERTSWTAGPFVHAVEVPSRVVEEERPGYVRVETTRNGARVVYGPWRVTVRGIGARAQRRVIARWEITRVWSSDDAEPRVEDVGRPLRVGASESVRRLGASERRIGAASEVRLAGASEVLYLGASELRRRGASERLFAGASERRWGGASERRWAGASELRWGGASERVARGASERVALGGSERAARGASERVAGGASERLARGASERVVGGASERLAARADDAATDANENERPQPPRW
ncbi:MAG TPA: DUF4912 domain-containing protein [Candidatus Binatia bacterium]